MNHSFAYTGRGALGELEVTGSSSSAPNDYPRIASPFDGGLTETTGLSGEVTPVETAPAEDAAGGGGGAGVSLEAAITGFAPGEIEADAGTVGIEMTNRDAMPHDFTIDELG
ncbi:MAG TPA: hypothetical protein VE962_06840, partial [Actinomycetota bacterium]|nr:hypothetical protein [Actinomycetota bacterium]